MGVEPVPATDGVHRRLVLSALVLSAAGIAAFVVLRLLAPFHHTGWDEAYYLGVGANLLAGRGLVTAFGEFPAIHSPLWPLVLQAPAALLPVDPVGWGHLLTVLSGGAVVGLTAWYAWRSVRLAAPVAVAALIAFPFLLDLAGWMGLDLPAAALALVYVAVGIEAVRRGSFTLGLAAGVVLAVAFLVKELVVPFVPVPILAGLLRSTSPAATGRATAGILLAATLGTSWWFIVHVQETGVVYRLGTPGWTLVPLVVAAVVLAALGLVMGRIAPRTGRPLDAVGARRMVRIGWLGALAWAGLLTAYFAVAPNPIGAPLLVPAQVALMVPRVAPDLAPILVVGLIGATVAIADRIRTGLRAARPAARPSSDGLLQPDDPHAVDDLLVAVVCGFPFVLLVTSVGEGPRHYIAHVGLIVALGAVGWTRLLVAAARILGTRRSRHPTPSRVGRRPSPAVAIGAVLAIVVGSAVAIMAASLPAERSATDVTRAEAVATTTAWVREHLAPGSTVAFGSGFSMETSLGLLGDYRLALVGDETGIDVDASSPSGLRALDGTRADDWVALWTSRRDVTALDGYRAGRVVEAFRGLGPAIWIHTALTSEEAPSPLLEALARARGLEVLERWSRPSGESRLETVVYRVDPERLAFGDDIVLDPAALARIVRAMERDPDAYREAAATLHERAVPVPSSARATELLTRLRTIAER